MLAGPAVSEGQHAKGPSFHSEGSSGRVVSLSHCGHKESKACLSGCQNHSPGMQNSGLPPLQNPLLNLQVSAWGRESTEKRSSEREVVTKHFPERRSQEQKRTGRRKEQGGPKIHNSLQVTTKSKRKGTEEVMKKT